MDLTLRCGEVHALVGENGSGKSTLTKIATGEYQPDAGSIFFEGEPVHLRTPAEGISRGISAIAQEIPLVPQLTIAENVLLGRMPTRRGVVDWAAANRTATDVLATLDAADLDPRRLVGILPLDLQQIVSIARALAMRSKVLIFDEATSSLTEDEVEALFRVIRGLRTRGVGVIFITHRLKEIYSIADVVTVLRDGALIGTLPIDNAPEETLTRMMVGRELGDYYHKREVARGRVVLDVRGLQHHGSPEPVNLTLHAGEIVGLAGLVGAGRSALLATLFGLHRHSAARSWWRVVPCGCAPPEMRSPPASRSCPRTGSGQGWWRTARCGRTSRWSTTPRSSRGSSSLPTVNAPSPSGTSRSCRSGRLTSRRPCGSCPAATSRRWSSASGSPPSRRSGCSTNRPRGIDVGAKSEIFRLMGELAASGTAILMSSSELIDLLGVCDRVVVMFRGRIVGEMSRAEASEERVVYYATGQSVA